MRTSRIIKLEQYIHQHEVLSLEQLCEEFSISMSTLRRDVSELRKRGSIQKVYGGVQKSAGNASLPFNTRSGINPSEKAKICSLASRFIEEDDIIFIDTGSTTCGLIETLDHLSSVTVVTNNIDTILRAIPRPNITLCSLQGVLNRSNNSLSPVNSDRIFSDFNIQKAFMAASSVSLDNGVSHSDPLENSTKRAAMKNADKKYLLVDQNKFGHNSLHSYAPLSRFDCIVTNEKPAGEFLESLGRLNVDCLYE